MLKSVRVTPTLDTGAYASGDRLGSLQTISDILPREADTVSLHSIAIVDAALQSAAMDLLFFSQSPTIASADNAPIDITDAEMKAKCLGSVSIAGSDYVALANNSVATLRNIDLAIKGDDTTQRLVDLFCIPVVRAAPTYAADSLVFVYSIEHDKL